MKYKTPVVQTKQSSYTLIENEIKDILDSIKKHETLTSFNAITLSDEWKKIEALAKKIADTTFSTVQKQQLEQQIEALKKECAKWQITIAQKAIQQAASEIDTEILSSISTTDNVQKRTDRFKELFYNLALRFPYGAALTLESDIEKARKESSPGEQNVFTYKTVHKDAFNALQKSITSLHIVLVFLFDEAIKYSSNPEMVTGANTVLDTIDILETTYKDYFADKNQILGTDGIAKERKRLQDLHAKSRTLPVPPIKKEQTTTSMPPALPKNFLKQEKEKVNKAVAETKKETETVVTEISRGNITAKELQEAKKRLGKTKEIIEESMLPEVEKTNLKTTLESELLKIRAAVSPEQDDDLEEWGQ